jgi:hypothetical protein
MLSDAAGACSGGVIMTLHPQRPFHKRISLSGRSLTYLRKTGRPPRSPKARRRSTGIERASALSLGGTRSLPSASLGARRARAAT